MSCMTSSYSKTSVFVRPHGNDKQAFSKICTLESVWKHAFSLTVFTRYVSTTAFLRGSQSDHVDALMFSGGIPNVVAAGKAVLKDWNRSVLTHLIPTIDFFLR